jgi:cation transport protein ChaC
MSEPGGEPDPFAHHPVLRDKILDPSRSFFRTFRPADFDERMQALGHPPDWRFSDAEIEAARRAFLAGRLDRDLWVFAYGSLMWDPAFHFAEVRRARVEGYARKFCLKDTFGARGTPEAPGLHAALDTGEGCDGLAFRIAQADIDEETGYIWRRELVAPAYKPVFIAATTAAGPVEVLAMAADHDAAVIRPDLTRAEQVRYLATGAGMLGTSLEYIENLAAHFAVLGIEDDEVTSLLAEARAYAAAPPG